MSAVTKIGIGTKAWFDSKRRRAQHLIHQVDEGYVELARILYELYDTPKDNDPKQLGVFQAWSHHSNFGVFCEEVLGLHRRKANRLRNVGRCLDVSLAAIPEPLKKRLIALGWTKLNELARIFVHFNDLPTITQWADTAEELSYHELLKSVALTLDKVGVQHGVVVPDITAVAGSEDDEEEDDGDDEGSVAPSSSGEQTAEQAAQAPPELPRTKVFRFLCMDEQIENVQEALDRAQQLSNAQVTSGIAKSGLLSLICLDFLATNDFGKKADPKTLKKYLKRLETALGVRLVAVQDKDGVLYGQATMKKLLKAIAEAE